MYRGSAVTVGVVIPASWMKKHGVEPQHVREAGARAYVVCRGSRLDIPLSPCARCCPRSGLDNVDLGTSMFESYGAQEHEGLDGAPEPIREFVFPNTKTSCTSSRLHLGGKVELVLAIRGPDGSVVAHLRSVPLNLLSKPPKHQLLELQRLQSEQMARLLWRRLTATVVT
eukprot:m51a1_g5315 hypothetical protein (170) ;mRNA; r:301672-302730